MSRAGADLWVEEFVPLSKDPIQCANELYEYGLTMPEQILTVTPPGGGKPMTLLIGKESPAHRRAGGPLMPPKQERSLPLCSSRRR